MHYGIKVKGSKKPEDVEAQKYPNLEKEMDISFKSYHRAEKKQIERNVGLEKVFEYREKVKSLPEAVIIGVKITRVTKEELLSNGYVTGYPTYVEITRSDRPLISKMNGEEARGTLYDPAMGSINPHDMSCQKCRDEVCLGHPGKHLFHPDVRIPDPLYTDMIVDILDSICPICNEMYLDEEHINSLGIPKAPVEKRLKAIAEESKKIGCINKGEYEEQCLKEPKRLYNKSEMKTEGRAAYKIKGSKNDIDNYVDMLKIDEMFEQLKESVVRSLGFSKKSDLTSLLLVGIIIPATINRLPHVKEGRQVDHDDTIKLSAIIEASNVLRKAKELESKMQEFENDTREFDNIDHARAVMKNANIELDKLYKSYYSSKEKIDKDDEESLALLDKKYNSERSPYLISTEKAKRAIAAFEKEKKIEKPGGIATKTAVLYKSVAEWYKILSRIYKSKKSIIRRDILGKHGCYSGRAVVSPASGIETGEIIIPSYLAPSLGREETVTNQNKITLRKMLRNGKISYVLRNGEYKVTPASVLSGRTKLKIGDVVVKHLKDGDLVLIGRPPSIKPDNMQAFFARVMDYPTIGLHLASTTGYNADFDGDEMNIYVPQSPEAIREGMLLMYSCRNLISPASSKPTKSVVYNALSAWSDITTGNVPVPIELWRYVRSILTNRDQLEDFESRLIRYGRLERTGKTLFSMLLPSDFDYPVGKEKDRGVIIKSGILLEGRVDDEHIGAKLRGIIRLMEHKYGEQGKQITSNFLTDAYEAAYEIQRTFAQTVDAKDCYYGEIEAKQGKVDLVTGEKNRKIREAQIALNILGPKPQDPRKEPYYEQHRMSIISQIGNVGAEAFTKALKDYEMDNNMAKMISGFGSGAKGNLGNIACLGGSVGQQHSPNGSLLKMSMTGNTRCLSTNRPGDISLQAGGYCVSNYGKGLTPDDLMYSNQGGRPGQADTSTKVPQVGTISRHLIKASENLYVDNQSGVRNQSNKLVQPIYGDDGLNPSSIIQVAGVPTFIDLASFADKYNNDHGWIKKHGDMKDVTTTTIEEMKEKAFNSPNPDKIDELILSSKVPAADRRKYLVDVWKTK